MATIAEYDALVKEYCKWCMDNGYPPVRAKELVYSCKAEHRGTISTFAADISRCERYMVLRR